MYSILFECTPALFLIEYLVHECGWCAYSGQVAHKVFRYSHVVVTYPLYEFHYNVQYLRTLGNAMMVSDKRHDDLTGQCHVEENCEALLARLVASMRANPQCKSLDTACDLFFLESCKIA